MWPSQQQQQQQHLTRLLHLFGVEKLLIAEGGVAAVNGPVWIVCSQEKHLVDSSCLCTML